MGREDDIMNAYSVVFDRLVHLGPGDPRTTGEVADRLREALPAKPRGLRTG